ncbi:MAG: immunoglobulin domain-containing protein [Candidatus Kapabacteria bacterium]|nr:immunoglobulin domain-containing protein [Ignavibacteriota bacterium]MCW5885081.1 immunoglobulin domain-containing protein [Candidatus Kapabacteria bacterium]
MKNSYKIVPFILVIGLIIYFTIEVYATSTGRVMRTSTFDGGCGGSGCHGTSANTATSLSLTSGSLIVDPGTVNSFNIRVTNSNSQITAAGINIAVKTSITGSTNIGDVGAPIGSGLQVLINELTHTTPKTLNNGNADFEFTWEAPMKPGKYFLRAVGNAVNGDGGTNGDQWNWMEPQELIVRGVELNEPKGGEGYCAGSNLIIRWESAGIEDIRIELSNDGGTSWNYVINQSFKAVGGSYTWSIPADFQQGDKFRIRLLDVTNPNRKSEMTSDFGIFGQFTISKHPDSKEMCPGDNHILYVNTTGTGLKYQWRKNGAAIVGATDSVLVLNNVNSGSTGFYGVIVSSECFSPIISDEADIQVRTPTVIKTQPRDQNVCPGGVAIFQIDADAHALKYQWYKGVIPIQDATSGTLTINNVRESDVANYYCNISGFCGTEKSNTVKLVLNNPPQITKQPSNVTACERTDVTFSIEASGLDNIYDWYFNEKKISLTSNSEFKIENVNSANSGTYYCMVRNNCGDPVKSREVQLTVNPLPAITMQPQSRVAMEGDRVELSVSAEHAKTYRWRKNNQVIAGETETTLVIESALIDDGGDYDCVITNDCGTSTTIKAKLTVNQPEPGPRINFASMLIDFGDVFEENHTDSLFTGFINNIGNEILLIDSIRIITSDTVNYFEMVFEDSTEVATGEAVDISIKFTPFTSGLKEAKLKVYSNAIGDVPDIDIKGAGAFWDVVSNRSKVDLGIVDVGKADSVAFRIFNQSDYKISWIDTDFRCENNEENAFRILSPELPATINAKSSKDIEVEFAPKEKGNFDCFMTLNFFGTDKTLEVEIVGIGNDPSSVDADDVIKEFRVFPNPASNDLTFEFTLVNYEDYELQIIDNSGSLVKSHKGFVDANNMTYTWDGRNDQGIQMPSGSYRVMLISANVMKSINIILIK